MVQAINGLTPITAFIVGLLARGEFVMGTSDIDMVVIVGGEPPFRARVIGSPLGDVEVVVFTLDEFCRHRMDNNMMLESLRIGIPIIGDQEELMKQCK